MGWKRREKGMGKKVSGKRGKGVGGKGGKLMHITFILSFSFIYQIGLFYQNLTNCIV